MPSQSQLPELITQSVITISPDKIQVNSVVFEDEKIINELSDDKFITSSVWEIHKL